MKIGLLLMLCMLTNGIFAQSPYPKDEFTTKNGKKIEISFIKHGSLAITYDGIHFQIDPVTNYKENVTDYTHFPKADYILLTHEHRDHYDSVAIALLEKKSTKIILNKAIKTQLNKGIVMKNGDKRVLQKDVTIEAVPAYNTTKDRLNLHPKGRDNGYILTLDGFRIYVAGDTEDIPEMNKISAIDIAFLPVNQPYTMTIEQAEKAAKIIRPKVFYPYHFNDTPVEQLQERLKGTSIDVRIRPMN